MTAASENPQPKNLSKENLPRTKSAGKSDEQSKNVGLRHQHERQLSLLIQNNTTTKLTAWLTVSFVK
ncbi:TPA: hypothetical protein OOF39_004262 [Kluyvera ascorbata]|uniref:hypothetical protein n=1 Tax=Kluyvera TaxID=579 RepID=UPI0013D6FDF6|nr:hypothetical protein [Kluyvera sp. CRP]UAK19619.1 hypothetical protein K7B04_20335 [Kluyvera sp. CRP]HCR3984771.1 hypothetical protein [Kluyvera ascorbata]HDT6543687.1 hypothetical protein [Kluyvera ascorbata]